MKQKEIKEKLVKAFQSSDYKWRTARGLAKDTGLPIQSVIEFLDNSDSVIRAKKTNNQGQSLYSLRPVYEEKTPLATKVLNAILNKITE